MKTVAIFFGSFNPIHENHMRIVQYALNSLDISIVYLVPNGIGNPFKQTISLDKRIEFISERVRNIDDIHVYRVSEDNSSSWEGRGKIAKDIRLTFCREKDVKRVRMVQLIGQDSYESALKRCNKGKGIYGYLNRQLYIIPRSSEYINIPPELKSNVKIIDGYRDLIPLSSTIIRDKIQNDENISEQEMDLNVLVMLQKYYKLIKKEIILVMGGPGCGKSTMCKSYEDKGYFVISTGDLYRCEELGNSDIYKELENSKKKYGMNKWMVELVTFIHKKVQEIMQETSSDKIIIDGLRPDDISLIQDQIGKINRIIYLYAHFDILKDRLTNRQRHDDTICNIDKRIAGFLKRMPYDIEKLKSCGVPYEVVNTT